MKRSVLHIIDSLAVGGAEKLLVGIINKLEGYEQHLIILKGPELLLPQVTSKIKFKNLGCRSLIHVFTKLHQVSSYIKKNKIDIVHSHLFESNIVARLSTPKSICLINSIHAISSLASYKINRKSLYLEKLTYKKRHFLIAVSKAVLDDFEEWVGLKGGKEILYNFVDEKFFQPFVPKTYPAHRELRLVAVGNLRWQKNYPYLLNAFENIPKGISLDIYGEGGLRESLQKEIDEKGLPVRLCGIHHNMEKVLPLYDAFVMSSFYEGQPVSLLEAMACGLPAILADIPVLKEVTGDKAVYFDINDTMSFRTAIEKIMNDEYDLAHFAAMGHKRVNEFGHLQQYLGKLTHIYENACIHDNLN